MILHYLHHTSNMGTIIKLNGTLDLDCYIDADFARLCHCNPDHEPTSVKSCTGFIIALGGAPIIWKSQLQSLITLSTMEAKYLALSHSLHTLLPLYSLLLEVATAIGVDPTLCASIHVHAFKDNQGAYLLVTNQQLTNRTKYYLVKCHHFWGHVKDGTLEICKVATDLQRPDGHTKGLLCKVFKRICKLNQGW